MAKAKVQEEDRAKYCPDCRTTHVRTVACPLANVWLVTGEPLRKTRD